MAYPHEGTLSRAQLAELQRQTLEDVRATLRAGEREDLVIALGTVITELETAAWSRGLDFAADLAQRDREHFRDLLLQVVTYIDSKDRADGIITYEVYPDPVIYDWPERKE